ncbi:MAG: AAA family ATPase [Deltaproteobacteria bacterium]|nr:AAA family ATPase [Deltaproteobacteria bacterium]
MAAERLRVSILYGAGEEDTRLREVLEELPNLRFIKQALDHQTFLEQHENLSPDLVVVDLDGLNHIPPWLEQIRSRLPKSHLAVCSQSRDPDFLIRVMNLKVDAFIQLPPQVEEVQAMVERLRQTIAQEREADGFRSQLLAVTGTKGGVGVTAVSTNLAVALSERYRNQVILVDLARPFPQAGQFLDLKGTHTIVDLIQGVDSLDALFIQKTVQRHKSSLDVLLGSYEDSVGTGYLADPQTLRKIFGALRESYQWIVIDLGSWIDLLYATVLEEADQILLITELTVPDLQNLKRLKAMFFNWDVDFHTVKVVVNRYAKDFALSLKDVENIFLQPVFATLPSDYNALIEAINQGLSLDAVAPRSKLWRGLQNLARELISRHEGEQPKGFFRRLLS